MSVNVCKCVQMSKLHHLQENLLTEAPEQWEKRKEESIKTGKKRNNISIKKGNWYNTTHPFCICLLSRNSGVDSLFLERRGFRSYGHWRVAGGNDSGRICWSYLQTCRLCYSTAIKNQSFLRLSLRHRVGTDCGWTHVRRSGGKHFQLLMCTYQILTS